MEKLKSMRLLKCLRLNDVAEVLRVTARTVFNYETGKRKPSIEVLKKLSKFYECTVDDLID